MTEVTEEMAERAATTIRDWTFCGIVARGKRRFCDDKEFGDDAADHECRCRRIAKEALKAALNPPKMNPRDGEHG